LEGHILSPLAVSGITNFHDQRSQSLPISKQFSNLKFPALGLVISGGNTQLIQINKVGDYKILAETQDDALGEALDKGARMLGFGYPGGAILEKFAKLGNPKSFTLPIPIVGQEKRMMFTYSGLKTAMMRLVESEKLKSKSGLTKQQIYNLAACFQNIAFTHLLRVTGYIFQHSPLTFHHLFVGGGVAANVEVRKRLKKLGREFGVNVLFPYSKKLYGDNAAMIGVAAYFKAQRGEYVNHDKIDRDPRAKISA
jgi:N6-L-threonylcarbamoyladenine synthase